MTKQVISVHPEDLLDIVVQKLFKHGFDGVPVIDKENKLVGLVTQYDLLTKSSGIHLPTLEKVLSDLPVLKKDTSPLKKTFNDIHKLKIKDIMNSEPITTRPDEPIADAARIFVEHHRVNPVPVVDQSQKLVGILSRYDVIKLYEIEYLGSAIGKAHDDAAKHANKSVEKDTHELLKSMKKEYVLVSKWRSRFWYLIAALFFIAGFIVALAWVISITFE